MESTMVFWLSFYSVFFLLSAMVGYYKRNVVAGVLLGYVLGPIGFILILLSKDRNHGRCPHCQSYIHVQSYFCPHCEQKCHRQVIQ